MKRVVFKRWKWERFSYKTSPKAVVTKNQTEDILEFPPDGNSNYSITIRKKSIYDTPICYLNMLNPFAFLLNFKVVYNAKAEAEAVLTIKQVEFFSKNNDTYLELVLPNDGIGDKIICNEQTGATELHIKTKNAPPEVRQRYVVTKIANALFWFMAVMALCLLAENDTGVATALVAALITGGGAAETVYTVLKAKRKYGG